MPSDNPGRRTTISLLLVVMFLFADLALPSALPEWQELEEEVQVKHAVANYNSNGDTYISAANPTITYGGVGNATLESVEISQTRLLLSFPMNYSSSDTIHSATITLKCWTDAVGSTDMAIYPASLSSNFEEANASWMSRTGTNMWNLQGADGSSDRGAWEPPVHVSSNGSVYINVTAMAQSSAKAGSSNLSVVLASTGATYNCGMSEHTTISSRPVLTIDSSSTTPGNGGSVTADFATDDMPLMTGDFILTADTTPTMSYNSLVGSGAEFQFSLDSEFKDSNDLDWHYSTMDNAFSTTGAVGEFTIPTSDAFSNGSKIFYRVRSLDSTDQLSSWSSGNFLLPNHNIALLPDGSAVIEIDMNDLGLDSFIEDATVDENNKNVKYGSSTTVKVEMTTSRETLAHFSLNLDQLGLHDNATIIDASLNLTRVSSTGSPLISIHEMGSSGLWTEDDVTWRYADASNLWSEGGRDYVSLASDSMVNSGSSTSDYSYSLVDAMQGWVDAGASGEKDFVLVGRSESGAYATTGTVGVEYHSSQTTSDANKPVFFLRYDWDAVTMPIPVQLGPEAGKAVWNKTGHNLSGNTTPTIEWNATINTNQDIIFQMATDELFRERTLELDTRVDNNFTLSDGHYNMTGNDELSTGNMYFWRISYVNADGQVGPWTSSNFLVSSSTSTWLGGDRYEFRLKHGNGTNDGMFPECADTYIDSGTPNSNFNGESEMQVSYNTWPSETTILFSCDLVANLLPDGYAIESAGLDMTLADYPSGSPNLGAWESHEHNWSAETATWATLDGTSNWGVAGAKGWERGSLLSSVTLDSSYSSGSTVNWNVTQAVQNAMRESRPVDLIIGVTGVGSGQSRDALLYPGSSTVDSRKPELTFVYVPGSDAVPNSPAPISPANGSWSVTPGIEVAPEHTPTVSWSFSGNLSIGGWSVQFDKVSTFDSPEMFMSSSWTDSGFDTTNLTYTLSSNLENGTTWYWRVRAISSTNQLGGWSNFYNFMLPDLTTWSISNSSASYELHHRKAMPQLNVPNFEDTYVIANGSGSDSTYDTSSTIKVGEMSNGYQAAGLISIPLNSLPTPNNARVTGAELHMYSQFGSSVGEPLAVRPVLQSWDTDANGTTYDGVNNWSQVGGRDIGVDIGEYVDLADSVSAGWVTWDVTEAVQAAMDQGTNELSLMIYAAEHLTTSLVTFTSTEGGIGDRPWLNLTWSSGQASIPTNSGSNAGPANDEIVWDTNSHALMPEYTPTLSWTHSNASSIDHWRLFIMDDADDEMQGYTMYDSRVDSAMFDLVNLEFTPADNITHTREVAWMVQPIVDGMLGPRSSKTVFHIPVELSGEVDADTAWVSMQEGAMVPALDYPAITEDTRVDSGNQYADYSSSNLIWGRSPSSSSHYSNTLISFDLTVLNLPSAIEVTNATLELSPVSGSGSVLTSVSVMNTAWSETSNWSAPSSGSSWIANGAHQSADSDAPLTLSTWVNSSSNRVVLNVTAALQQAIYNGDTTLELIIQGENMNNLGYRSFFSSEATTPSQRPSLNFTYDLANSWVAPSPTGLGPLDGTITWDLTSERPDGMDDIAKNWTSGLTNHSTWVVCASDDPRIAGEDAYCDDMNAPTNNNTFDASNLSFMVYDHFKGDEWFYWKVRADQDHRIGEWSDIVKYRNPEAQGSDDGAGNHTIELRRGSVFTDTGLLPAVPDVELYSGSTTNAGSATMLDLGMDSSGIGEAQILLEFDLSQFPWPSAMTPTSMVLKMYRQAVIGTSSSTISVHACSTFSEGTAHWNNTPTCSASEVTRSTLTLLPPDGWIEWDLTSLAQSNIANGNTTMTVLLKEVGTPSTTHRFYSSDYSSNVSRRPTLVLDYIDNSAGVVPPGQPSLIYPQDGEVLYDVGNVILDSKDTPTLSWSPINGATGYIVTIANSSGVFKYKSWESQYINGTTFRFNDALNPGDVFNWWVQGVNQSIPGPSSARWSFAIGNPDHVDNGDLTYTYTFQTGSEVSQFGHTNIREGTITSANPTTNYGDEDTVQMGTGCFNNLTSECRAVFGLDNSQVPLPPYQNVHSAALGLYVDSWEVNGMGTSVTLSVHRVLNNAWSQSSATWDNADSLTAWGASGMQAGVDYDATALSTTTVPMTASGWIWLDISADGMMVNNDNKWVIIATPNNGLMNLKVYSSEHLDDEKRPKILMNLTNVTTIDISPQTPTTNADTPVNFNQFAYDHLSALVSAPVEWSASAGTIDANGNYTPSVTGQHTITACFGLVCSSTVVDVTPGSPTTLIASPLSATITADETLDIDAYVVDQFNNLVPGEAITYTPSNGSMGGDGTTFYPYATGLQTIDVAWNGQTVSLLITVSGGAPDYFTLSGCSGVVPAGEWCDITHTLHDQFGNELDVALAGSLTWTTSNGNYSDINEQYFPDHVGTWILSLSSTSGAGASLDIEVGHGQMASLELAASSTSITADDRIWINTTRIDVRGNRLPVVLPAENWTKTADGVLTPGYPATWDPFSRGSKTIQAKYEDIYQDLTIAVSAGSITSLVMIVDSNDVNWQHFDMTSDEELEIKLRAMDKNENRWTVDDVDWSVSHITYTDQYVLKSLVGDSTDFEPVHASTNPYMITATYDDGETIHTMSINVTVSHGALINVDIFPVFSNGATGEELQLTADDDITFTSALNDADNNPISSDRLAWTLINDITEEEVDITDSLFADGMVWQASEVGNWTIVASNTSTDGVLVKDSVSFQVLHGKAVILTAESIMSAKAGDFLTIQVTGTDSDQNQFPQNVIWEAKDGAQLFPATDINATENEGEYVYSARREGNHELVYSSELADNSLTFTVTAQRVVAHLKVELSSESTEQLGTFTVTVTSYDEFWNEFPLPASAKVEATGRASVAQQGAGIWKVKTLDEGTQTVTVKAGTVTSEVDYEVTGTFQGFFEAGGLLYYVAAVLGVIIVIVLLVVMVMFMRNDDDYYDDDDEDDDEYEDEDEPQPARASRGSSAGPSGPAPGPSGPAPVVEEEVKQDDDYTNDDSYRVDEEGTEWWEDDSGTWWYRQPGQEDWSEWVD